MMRTPPSFAEKCASEPTRLAGMRDCYRPLLLFASSATDPQLRSQLVELKQDAAALVERNVRVLVLVPQPSELRARYLKGLPFAQLSHDEALSARRRFGPPLPQFSVVLLGKDGGEKLKMSEPLTATKLRETIDAMPMRREEMRRK